MNFSQSKNVQDFTSSQSEAVEAECVMLSFDKIRSERHELGCRHRQRGVPRGESKEETKAPKCNNKNRILLRILRVGMRKNSLFTRLFMNRAL